MRSVYCHAISRVVVLLLCACLFLFCFQGDTAAKIAFGSNGIFVMNDNGGGRRQLTYKDDSRPRWSPDGTHIAFVRHDDGDDQRFQIYVMNVDGTNLQQLTHVGEQNGMPAWSPDGKKIVFDSNRSGSREFHVLELATQNITQLTGLEEPHRPAAPDWSPDGQQIAYEKFIKRPGVHHKNIWVMNADGTNPKPLLPDPNPEDPTIFRSRPRWSPDGSRILFTVSTGEWQSRLVIATIGGGIKVLDLKEKLGEKMLIHGTWMDDGRSILFGAELYEDAKKDLDIYHYNLYRYELETGKLRKLTRKTSGHNSNPDWVSGALSVFPVEKKKVVWGELKQ